ncbi:MAG: hypothetical protein V2B18_06975 [Pseudomonadota bacterium]
MSELTRAFPVPEDTAAGIMKAGNPTWGAKSAEGPKVVSILDTRRRRLDSVVADSILDQVRVIKDLLQSFLQVADPATPEERFWLSQQVLTFVRKFSGRELEELEDIVEWFRNKPGR